MVVSAFRIPVTVFNEMIEIMELPRRAPQETGMRVAAKTVPAPELILGQRSAAAVMRSPHTANPALGLRPSICCRATGMFSSDRGA